MAAFSNISSLSYRKKNSISLPLMPMPHSVIKTSEIFRVDSAFSVSIAGISSERIILSVERLLNRLSCRTGKTFSHNFFQKDPISKQSSLIINCNSSAGLHLGADESYELKISNRNITLKSETDLGSLFGIETLLQLLDADSSGYFFHGAEIKDKPRFAWRGLLLDVSRHFIPLDVIKRNLDGMSAVKKRRC
jgi:hexosaminidase